MEQHLRTCLRKALEGAAFPQFTDSWVSQVERAKRLLPIDFDFRKERIRIALVASDPAWFWACFFVAAQRDWDVFLFSPRWGEKERTEALEIAQPHWIVDEVSIRKNCEASESPKRVGDEIEGFRVMISTGGSSGKLRFAIHDFETLSAAVEGLKQHFGLSAISSLCMLPLYHVSGFMQTIRALLTGGKVVFSLGSDLGVDCQMLFSQAPEDSFLSLVPTQLRKLIEDGSMVHRLREFRAVFCGGGPLPEDLARASREARLPLAPTYGMTETAAQVATLLPEEFLYGIEGQGRPLPHISIEIFNAELESEGVGDILIQGSSLFRGYFGGAPRREGFFATGDRGRLDAEGRISVVGRGGRRIISGGENIDLQEIEEAFRGTGLVEDVAAFGVDDEKWGARLCVAYVTADRKNQEAGLRREIGRRLASFKQPKSWLSIDLLPRNVLGKIDLESLRKLVAEEPDI